MKKYIVKQKVISALINEANTHSNPVKRAYTRAAALIEQITAEDVQPVKRGHWEKLTIVPATDTGNCILARCSKCGDTVFYTVTGREITLKYCPNCGDNAFELRMR